MGSGSLLKLIFQNFDLIAGPLVTLVYPLYASVKAIETKTPKDDQQWLTYWVLYSFITLFELTFARVLEWLPIWSYAKLIFSFWLVLPQFNGAAYVYQKFLRPVFVNYQTVNIWYYPHKSDSFSRPDDILSAAERYIEEHGTEAFEKMINKADKAQITNLRHNNHANVQPDMVPRSRNNRKTLLEEVQAQNWSQAEKESNPWSENYSIFGGEDYRY